MYRYDTTPPRGAVAVAATTTPASSSRRSTRSARGSAKRGRRSRGGFGKDDDGSSNRIKKASGPARKWVKVMRPPAPRIGFLVALWVPMTELTEAEFEYYETEQRQKAHQQQQVVAPEAQNYNKATAMDVIQKVPENSQVPPASETNVSARPSTNADEDGPSTTKVRLVDPPETDTTTAIHTTESLTMNSENNSQDGTNTMKRTRSEEEEGIPTPCQKNEMEKEEQPAAKRLRVETTLDENNGITTETTDNGGLSVFKEGES